jgi:hypothetical protein
MKPEEKAIELFNKMSIQTYSYQPYAGAHYNIDEIGWEAGKKCALIAVDEILKTQRPDSNNYWQEVKEEIEKL